jgi:hypothetical protein
MLVYLFELEVHSLAKTLRKSQDADASHCVSSLTPILTTIILTVYS